MLTHIRTIHLLTRHLRALAIAAALVLVPIVAPMAAPLAVIGFNVESDQDTDPKLVAGDIRGLAPGADVFVLTEVDSPDVAELYRRAAAEGSGKPFAAKVGATGGADRIALLWRSDRLTRVRDFEIVGGYSKVCRTIDNRVPRFRGTLVVELDDVQSKKRLWISGSHLQRDEAFNTCQARELERFSKANAIPHIAAGDFNFDWSLKMAEGAAGQRRAGFDGMTKDGTFRWIRPDPLIPTYCSEHRSVLDFQFASQRAQGWKAKAEILFPTDAYCARDAQGYSDHRPVRAVYEVR